MLDISTVMTIESILLKIKKVKMKYIKLLSLLAVFSTLLVSCSKENLTEVEDNVPDVTVEDNIIDTLDEVMIGSRSVTGSAYLATFVFDSTTMAVNNYSLSFKSGTTGATQEVFAGAWDPLTEDEVTLQEATYTGFEGISLDGFGSASTISEEGLEAFAAWADSGGDPETMPDLFQYLLSYDGGNLTYTISNITETTADVEVGGTMKDEDGNEIAVSGSFTADLN